MRRYRIGRSETNDIVIPDASVSRQHAEAVELGDGRFALSDLGSTFGTHVWQGQSWTPAKDTEIRLDTVIRFGEFRTTLMDVLSEAERMALGLKSPPPAAPQSPPPSAADPSQASPPPAAAPPAAAPPAAPPPEPPAATPAPRTQAPSAQPAAPAPAVAPPPSVAPPPEPPRAEATPSPEPAPRPEAAPRPPATREVPRAAPAPRGRQSMAGGKRRAMAMGLLAVGAFFAAAGGVIALVLALGSSDGSPPVREPRTTAGEGPQKFLEACTKDWGTEERRCRCFLAAAGPHLEAADYDDFATIVEGHLSGDSDKMESVMQQATEKRGSTAGARLSAAMKGVTRDCQAEGEPKQQ